MSSPLKKSGEASVNGLHHGERLASQWTWNTLAGAALIVLAALVIYLPSIRGGFVLDDEYLVSNPLVKASDGLFKFWFTTKPADYWPVTNSSFWIEWRLWGTSPTGYHVVNVLLHIASSLLVWAVLRKLSIPGAWLAALLFAEHPVNVESVAWISQRKNTLSMLFFLLSILWYLKAEAPARRGWYWLSLSAFTLAMLSKGSVAMLPVVLLIIAWWQRGKITKTDLMRTAPYFLVAAVLTAVNILFAKHGANIEIRQAGFAERLVGAGAVVWFYLYKALLPLNLAFIYPQWDIQVDDWRWWLPLAAAVAVTILLVWQRNSRVGRPLLFAWLFYCVALGPVMGFTDVGFMQFSLVADHYQHIAILAVVTLAAAGLALLKRHAQRGARGAATALGALVVVVLTYLAWQQSRLYVDPVTLYQATLVHSPRCWLAHNNLGNLLTQAGDIEEAIEHYQLALQVHPEYPDAEYNYGNALLKAGRIEEAIEHYQRALRLKPNNADVKSNLGKALLDAGRLPEAIAELESSLKLSPNNVITRNNLGDALFQSGRRDEAIVQLNETLRLQPDYAHAHFTLGKVLEASGQHGQALAHYKQASQLNFDSAELHLHWGNVLIEPGQIPDAIRRYQKALRLDPRLVQAHCGLGNALIRAGRPRDAIDSFRQALTLKPDDAQAQYGWGCALRDLERLSDAINHFEESLRLKSDYLPAEVDLAAAYAQANRFADAVSAAQRALDTARSSGQTTLAEELELRLKSYRAKNAQQSSPPQPTRRP